MLTAHKMLSNQLPDFATCKYCAREFEPARPLAQVCSPRCAVRKGEADKKAKKAAERALMAARWEEVKTPTEWKEECKKIVQKMARLRDRNDGCISCHVGPNYGGQWHGSHFRPAGNNAAVRFHLWNIHKSCAQCNMKKGGNLSVYRPRLVQKIGIDRVEWLESQTQPVKTDIAYLKRFKAVMGKRLKRMEARV